MTISSIIDWNGQHLVAVRSKGGVAAFADYDAQLIKGPGVWPPACIVQKLYKSVHGDAFYPDDQAVLEQRLGYYTDLQSVHSEDTMTWNYFGLLSLTSPDKQAHFSNWLISQLDSKLEVQWGHNEECTISLWRRIPHPDTYVPGGPEIDALIQGDRFVIIVEAKWCSPEDLSQGKERNKGQLQLREEFLAELGKKIYGDVKFGLLGVSLGGKLVPQPCPGSVPCWNITWETLCTYSGHPERHQVEKFYEWKRNLSTCAQSAQ